MWITEDLVKKVTDVKTEKDLKGELTINVWHDMFLVWSSSRVNGLRIIISARNFNVSYLTHATVLLYPVQPTWISRATVIIVSPLILLSGQELNKFAKLVVNSQQINIMAVLSLRARGRGFSPVTKRVTPGYFYWKIEEKLNQKKSLAVWFPAYLLYLPGNLKS